MQRASAVLADAWDGSSECCSFVVVVEAAREWVCLLLYMAVSV